MMNRRASFWIVIGITLLGALLRIVGLNNELWFDEILTLISHVRQPLPEIVSHYSRNNHIFYSVLAHESIATFGEYPWVLRLPAVVFGVACIPALYLLGTAVTSRLEAILAAGLIAVSYHHIWFSQNARGYSTLAFWTLSSTYFLIRGFRDNTLGWHIAYGCAAAMGLYTHVSMGFVLVAQLLACLNELRATGRSIAKPRMKRLAIGFTLAGVLSLVLYAPLVMQMHLVLEETPPALANTATLSWAYRVSLQSFETGLGTWGVLAGLLLLTAGLWSYQQENRLVFFLMIMPGLLILLGLFVLHQPLHPRFFFALIGFGFLLLARGAMWAADLISRGRTHGFLFDLDPHITGPALVGFMMLASVSSLGFLYQLPKQDYIGALRFVEATRTPTDTVITASTAAIPYRDYYKKTWPEVTSREELNSFRRSEGRVWMIYSFPEYLEPALANSIRQECPTLRIFHGTLVGGDVIVCALRPASAVEPHV